MDRDACGGTSIDGVLPGRHGTFCIGRDRLPVLDPPMAMASRNTSPIVSYRRVMAFAPT